MNNHIITYYRIIVNNYIGVQQTVFAYAHVIADKQLG